MLRPLEWLMGYDILWVSEEGAKNFINICTVSGIEYHALGRSSGKELFRLRLVASLRVRAACEAAGVEVGVKQRRGFPSMLCTVAHRPGIVLGLIICTVMMLYSSHTVWDVRIEGNRSVSEEAIKSTLRECGVDVGSDIRTLDIDSVQNKFLIASDEISWISVNIVGSIAEVEVREVAARPISPNYTCSNLVATQNGTVVELREVRGNIAVTLGEAVSKGDILVCGVWGDENSATRFMRSRGEVMALCSREMEIRVGLNFDKKILTGRRKTKKSLIFFDKEVKLFVNSGNLYTSCDIIEREEYLNLFGLGKLPFGIKTVEYVEYTVESAQRSEEQAREQANFLLWQKFFTEAPDASLVGKRIVGRLEGEEYILLATIESIENIACEQEVEINISE